MPFCGSPHTPDISGARVVSTQRPASLCSEPVPSPCHRSRLGASIQRFWPMTMGGGLALPHHGASYSHATRSSPKITLYRKAVWSLATPRAAVWRVQRRIGARGDPRRASRAAGCWLQATEDRAAASGRWQMWRSNDLRAWSTGGPAGKDRPQTQKESRGCTY